MEKGNLVLGFKNGQKCYIGDDIVVTVHIHALNFVKLEISAPRNVIVDREEIHERRINGVPR